MNPIEPDPELAKWVGTELRQLPDLPAPPSLIPNVLAALEAQVRLPWWQQPWLAWPRSIQAFSAAVVLAVLGWTGYFVLGALPPLDLATPAQALTAKLSWVAGAWNCAATLLNALATVAQAHQAWCLGACAVLIAVYLASVGLSTVGYRMIIARRL